MTRDEACKWGRIEAEPVLKHVRSWVEREEGARAKAGDTRGGAGVYALAQGSGVHRDTIDRYIRGDRTWMEFQIADKLIAFINPFLWHCDPDLRRCYQEFDFKYLDMQQPLSANGDGLLDRVAAGEPVTEIAEEFGMSAKAIYASLRKRERLAA